MNKSLLISSAYQNIKYRNVLKMFELPNYWPEKKDFVSLIQFDILVIASSSIKWRPFVVGSFAWLGPVSGSQCVVGVVV